MKKEAIKRFFTPDWKRFLIFVVLALVAFVGHIRSWVFSGKGMGLPKPPLFDPLAPFPFWVVWVILFFPQGTWL